MGKLPWERVELVKWSIIGMNHFYIAGQRRIYVAMGRAALFIKVEGPDTPEIWDELARKADTHNQPRSKLDG